MNCVLLLWVIEMLQVGLGWTWNGKWPQGWWLNWHSVEVRTGSPNLHSQWSKPHLIITVILDRLNQSRWLRAWVREGRGKYQVPFQRKTVCCQLLILNSAVWVYQDHCKVNWLEIKGYVRVFITQLSNRSFPPRLFFLSKKSVFLPMEIVVESISFPLGSFNMHFALFIEWPIKPTCFKW